MAAPSDPRATPIGEPALAAAEAHAAAAPASAVAEAPTALSVLADEECAKLLLEDAVVMDEESGSNRQLGVAFLYEVLQGRVQLKLLGQVVSPSLGELLTRYAHLKSARWGRETAESGEVEAA